MYQIINTYDQLMAARAAGLPDAGIVTRRWRGTREMIRNGWKVYRPGYNLGTETNRWDPDYGCKLFEEDRKLHWREARKKALEEAMAWVRKRYGIKKFARNRMGDYVDERVNKKFPLRKEK
jgi:hypothetical protein